MRPLRSPTSNCRLLCTFDMPSVCGCHSGDHKFGEADACSCCIHEKDSRQLLAVRASAVAGEFGLLQLQFRSSCEVARIPRTRLHSKDIDLNELRFEVNGKHCTKPMQAKTPSVFFCHAAPFSNGPQGFGLFVCSACRDPRPSRDPPKLHYTSSPSPNVRDDKWDFCA